MGWQNFINSLYFGVAQIWQAELVGLKDTLTDKTKMPFNILVQTEISWVNNALKQNHS